MDYVLGGVAALITGNVTPNRPRLLKRALTPTKHQPSPNVTPKSEFVEDRSIFLSPTMQKKKAIVKKSPKRIFQNPDLETTDNEEGNSSLTSPKADKVKKHLKDDLEADSAVNKSLTPQKSPKKKLNNKNESITQEGATSVGEQKSNENTPKKKKGKQISESESTENVINIQTTENVSTQEAVSPKKRKQKRKKSVGDTEGGKENDVSEAATETPAPTTNAKSPKKQKLNNPIAEEIKETAPPVIATKKKNKRRKKKSKAVTEAKPVENESTTKENESEETNKENLQTENQGTPKKKNKRKKSKGQINKPEVKNVEEKPVQEENDDEDDGDDNDDHDEDDDSDSENLESSTVNPNAITDKESDSEHESDDEIESENEETNKQVFESEKPDESSDDEEEEKDAPKEKKEVKKKEGPKTEEVNTEEEIKRTLFVGNVPYSAKCKKEIKKIFGKHGQIETIRIRTVPIKDGRFTPKLALIKNELHPERTTVNVYIKYAEVDSIYKALIENNTVLNEHHLRVSRSDSTGAEHDPRCSVFIGNLPFAMEDEALRAKFENCGPIQSVRIVRDKKTNAGKGFGYVNFESKDGVELALALTEEDLTVKNRILRVKRCTQGTDKKKQSNQQRGGNFQDRPQRGARSGPGRGGRVSQGDRQRSGSGPPGNQGRGGFNSGRGGGRFNSEGQRGGFNSGGRGGGFNSRGRGGGFNSGGRGGGRFNSDGPGRGGFNSGGRGGGRFNSGGDQGGGGGFKKFDNQRNQGQKDEEGREGAFRRIMHKRKNEEGNAPSDGPPNKRPNTDQPNKEKKVRKEFVGMTAEKKKKQKFDKGQKKKKALSEILTK